MPNKKDILPPIIWNKKIPSTNLEYFKKIIKEKYNKHFESYWDLHKWSVEDFPCFWKELWHYFEIVHSKPYKKIFEKTGPGFLDCEWFTGARFNFAENILRIRDDSTAIIYSDEYGCKETVTFNELFEEVKLYAAAFKKNGLRQGDTVACYMSNRKESVFAYLAATSIGAIFGGPQPYIKAKAASNVFSRMEATFLLAIDHHLLNGVEYHNIDNLPDIAENVKSLKKVIIVATRPETFSREISNIKNGCLLKEFLNSGRTPDGTVPDLKFAQLPFNHPIIIAFTSGTTGTPKGIVHAAGAILGLLCNIVLYRNVNKGDVMFLNYPIGWIVWYFTTPCLARGVTLCLYAGNPQRQDSNIWEIFSRFKIAYAVMTPNQLDTLKKCYLPPKFQINLEHLKILGISGSPPQQHHFRFVQDKIKEDVFVQNLYGCTESLYPFAGVDFNLPAYAGEIQVPSLGFDLKCYDEKGKSIVNRKGEMVVVTPTPTLPIYIWKDEGNCVLKKTYLSKYPGVWCQGDEMWINPKTKGFVISGRTDDTIIQRTQRILACDIYNAICDVEEIGDSICVGQQRKDGGGSRAVLFIQMKDGYSFTKEFRKKVEQRIADQMWFLDCVPDIALQIKDIPYNLTNKKMESTVKKIIANRMSITSGIRNVWNTTSTSQN